MSFFATEKTTAGAASGQGENSRYLLLSEIFPPRVGGSGRWFYDLYTRVESAKVVVLTNHAENCAVDTDSVLTVYRIPFSSASWGIVSIAGMRFYARTIRYVLSLIRRHQVETIHCGRTMHEGVIALAVKLITGRPYLCYVHGEDIEMSRSSREYKLLTSLVIRHASRLICNSENSARLLRQWRSAKESKIRVIHPGVDAKHFCPPTFNSGEPKFPGKKVILTVSRLQPRKGHDVMIQAMPAILARHPTAQYVIVGDGKQRDLLEGLIHKFGLEEKVTMLGECSEDEILGWYQRCDLFVLPNRQIGSDVEGFGIVLLEAQACETAVIAGDSGGTSEAMNPGSTGLVVDCRTSHELVREINALLDDPTRLSALGKRARRLVVQKFDWPVVVESVTQVFTEVERAGRRRT